MRTARRNSSDFEKKKTTFSQTREFPLENTQNDYMLNTFCWSSQYIAITCTICTVH